MLKRMKALRRKMLFSLKFGRRIRRLYKRNQKVFVCAESAVHGNMGDQALGFCRLKFLEAIGIPRESIVEYTARDRMMFWPEICAIHRPTDIFLLRGGGFWGDLWQDGFYAMLSFIKSFPKNPIVVFPQSVYFSETETGRELLELSKRLLEKTTQCTLCARDKHSGELLERYYPNIRVLTMPDTVLSYKPAIGKKPQAGKEKIVLCLRNDKEKKQAFDIEKELLTVLNGPEIEYQDTDIDFSLERLDQREEKLFELWGRFSEAKFVVTDRLHGMIFSTILGVPCIVLDNIDGKVGHQYRWLFDLGYVKYVEDLEQFRSACREIDAQGHVEYPVNTMLPLFGELKTHLLSL